MPLDGYKVPELIYAPAKRGAANVLIMLAGASGSGKTRSALELATGLAGDEGGIGFADTEHGRARYYADRYKFDHLNLQEPFRSELFEQAAIVSQRKGHKVWICDNFSWEHVGPGGQLEWHDAEIQRMMENARKRGNTQADWELRDKLNFTGWIAPKQAHTRMLQRMWQLNAHIILCCQAKQKTKMVKNGRKTEVVDAGWQPICGDDIPYAMTTSLMLMPDAPGVPNIIKPQEDLDPLWRPGQLITREIGAAIAAWARGDAAVPPPVTPGRTGGELKGEAKNRAVADELIAAFRATAEAADHLKIVDVAANRDRIDWFRKHRPQLHAEIVAALEDSARRTGLLGGKKDPGSGEPPPSDEPPFDPADPGYGPPTETQGALL